MRVDLHNLVQSFDNKDIASLLPLLDELENELPSMSNDGEQKRGLFQAIRINFHIGNFKKVVQLVYDYFDHLPFKFNHPVIEYYIRSEIAMFLESGNIKYATVNSVPDHRCQYVIELITDHFKRVPSRRAELFGKCQGFISSFEEFVALMNLLHFYSVRIDAASIKAMSAKYGQVGNPSWFGLNFSVENTRKKEQKYLFVGGVGRSGTTAMGHLLNLCDEISIFMELYSPYLGYSPKMFEKKSLGSDFFLRKHNYNQNLKIRSKIGEDSIYLGDKRPAFLNSWNITKSNFSPSAVKIVNLIRNPGDVLASFDKRYKKSRLLEDPWRVDMSPTIGESDLSCQLQVIREIQDSDFMNSIKLVRYPDVLVDFEAILDVFDFLEMNLKDTTKDRISHQLERNQKYIENKDRSVASIASGIYLTKGELDEYDRILNY